jgi:hemolysin activation/secretion protein
VAGRASALRAGLAVALLAALALLGAPRAARAQAQPPTPGTVIETVPERKVAPAPPPQLVLPREEAAAPDRGGPRFVVYGFAFSGNTVFTEAHLRRLLERYYDLQLNLFELNRAADAITRFYRDNGYPVARAIIPAQRVEDGLVRIQVVEGRVGRVVFEGNQRYSEAFLAERTAPLLAERVLTVRTLERALLLLNDLPGVKARVTLEPGHEFGTADVVVTIEERTLEAQAQLANSGRKEVGTLRLDIGASLNNPFGVGDQLSARAIRSEEELFQYRRVGYSVPFPNADGLRFSAGVSDVDYRVAGDFEALDIRGHVRTTDLGVSYPLKRSRLASIFLSAGQRHTVTEQSALGVPVSKTAIELYTASVAANWVHADSSASSFSAGFSGNGKDNVGPVAAPDALRARYDLDYTYLTGISPRWDFFFHGKVVQTAGASPDTEKFGLGGPDSVRAYRSSELRGDDGWLTQFEFRRQLSLGDTVGVASLFYDWGGVRNVGFASSDKLQGVGAGVTVFPARNLSVQLQAATPYNSREPGDQRSGPRVWLSIAAQF